MARKSRKNIEIEENVFANKLLRTAIYLRLSVEDKRKKADNSIDSQRSIVESFAEINPEFEIVAEFIDNGTTGTNFEREGFKSMICEVEKGNLDCIIVKDLSRFGRNVIDTGYYIEKFLPTHNVRFISVNDSFDSNDNSQGNIILPIKNMINEAYARDLSRKIKAQKRSQMERGEWTSGPPYGYLKDKNKRLVIDEDVAPTIKRIFKLVEDGVLLNEITRLFNSEGVPSPLATNKKLEEFKKRKKAEWQHTKIRKILRNEIYTGDMVQRKSVSKNPDDWIRVENNHDAIITKETFYSVQKILDKNYEKHISKEKVLYKADIFGGRVYCKYCKNKLSYKRNANMRYSYYCITNTRMGQGTCVSTGIRESALIDIVSGILEVQYEILLNKEKENTILARNKSNFNTIENLKLEIGKDKEFLRSLYENLINKILTIDDYNLLKNTYQERILVKSAELKATEENYKLISTIKTDFEPFIKTNVLDGNLVEALINKIYILKDKVVEIEFNFNIEEISEVYYG